MGVRPGPDTQMSSPVDLEKASNPTGAPKKWGINALMRAIKLLGHPSGTPPKGSTPYIQLKPKKPDQTSVYPAQICIKTTKKYLIIISIKKLPFFSIFFQQTATSVSAWMCSHCLRCSRFGFCVLDFLSNLSDFLSQEILKQK